MDWLTYFEHNKACRMSIPWHADIAVDERLRGPLARSLQRFQLGESGDGAHLKRVAASTGDTRYVAAIDLFAAEEQEHSALMARVLGGLGYPLLRRHWSDLGFRVMCITSGLRTELMVFMVAEVIAKRYFRVLFDATDDRVLRAVCAQILIDEDGHIAFHSDTLRPTFSHLAPPARSAVSLAWGLFFRLVCRLVAHDHRDLLHAVGLSQADFRSECVELFEEVCM